MLTSSAPALALAAAEATRNTGSAYSAGGIVGKLVVLVLVIYGLYRLKRWGRGE